jgi:hypothetical protein
LSLHISSLFVGLYVPGYQSEKPYSLLTYLRQWTGLPVMPGVGVGVCPSDGATIARMNATVVVIRLAIDLLLKMEAEEAADGSMKILLTFRGATPSPPSLLAKRQNLRMVRSM